jgi:hypothetical protein
MINRIARPWILVSNAFLFVAKGYTCRRRPLCRLRKKTLFGGRNVAFLRRKRKGAQPKQAGFPGRFSHATPFLLRIPRDAVN